jgi:hypothetical protein
MQTQWEYTVLKLPTDYGFFSGTDFDAGHLSQRLNEHGTEGWELVSMFDIAKVKGGSKFVMAIMKRPRS